ncbi:MAG: hypothetical protein K8F92_08460 [Hyphomicrobium sp.]|uniref:hypothetical protein n=1 Tax=Hyphomicrobium sp. TaxID=82 RepID=UPI001322713A|nr:hypothetical protein [Hyphomicrobium sp.]KAB2943595.1 MAG: hypothetical protein F9K20_02720 [Hyphomicrobium sp.]MBZ0209673.1 hypothetical protein [Hyphomicrobium sp.]
MRVKHLILAAVLFAGPGNSFAHEEANGPNGGQIADVQGHHVEFTVKDKEIVLFLTDEDSKPIASKGASGRVIIQAGGRQVTVALAPTDPNVMTAKLDAPLAARAKVVVSAKLGDGHDIQARFVAK